jgi:hypothetical protein
MQKPFRKTEDRPVSTAPSDVDSNQEVAPSYTPPDAATREAAAAFERDWAERQEVIQSSPILLFLKAHEIAGSPNELTICGYSGIRISLGDLRALVRAME